MKKLAKLNLKDKTKELRELPGVYQMLDKDGKIIYIGKSKNIKHRVASYFVSSAHRSKKISRMIHHLSNFNVFYTDTELDALVLECKWIKQYKPFYNTALTRQHKYMYLEGGYTDSYFIKASQQKVVENATRWGPFTNHRLALAGLQYIRESRPYLSCGFKAKPETCYPYQFKLCKGWCEREECPPIEKIMEQLIGAESNEIKNIDEKIERYAQVLDFERAAELLKQRRGIQYLMAFYKVFEEIESQPVYIGVIPSVGGEWMNKYYLINRGRIIATRVVNKLEEQEVIKEYKKIAKQMSNQFKVIEISEIDEVLIVESFRRKKMKVIEV